MGELQEETIQATKEIAYDLVELQREAVNLVPKFQEKFISYYLPWASPKLVTEYYSRMVDSYVDNVISATKLVNSLVVFNMESIQRLADSTKEYWRPLNPRFRLRKGRCLYDSARIHIPEHPHAISCTRTNISWFPSESWSFPLSFDLMVVLL